MSNRIPLSDASYTLSLELKKTVTSCRVEAEDKGPGRQCIVVLLKDMTQQELTPQIYKGYPVEVRDFKKRAEY
jgi:hypothetical protein